MKLLKKFKEGFTLVELVVVIAVIAILAGVSVATYVGITNNAKQSTANQEASTLKNLIYTEAVETYEGKNYTITMEYDNEVIVTPKEAAMAIDAKLFAEDLDNLVAEAQNGTVSDIQAKAAVGTEGQAGYVAAVEFQAKKDAKGYFFTDAKVDKKFEAAEGDFEVAYKAEGTKLVLTHTNKKSADVITVKFVKVGA